MVDGRDRVVVWLLCLRGCSTAGHDILESVVKVLFEGCRRAGIGRVKGLILVCLVGVICVFVPVEFPTTASALFLAVFLVGRCIC